MKTNINRCFVAAFGAACGIFAISTSVKAFQTVPPPDEFLCLGAVVPYDFEGCATCCDAPATCQQYAAGPARDECFRLCMFGCKCSGPQYGNAPPEWNTSQSCPTTNYSITN